MTARSTMLVVTGPLCLTKGFVSDHSADKETVQTLNVLSPYARRCSSPVQQAMLSAG